MMSVAEFVRAPREAELDADAGRKPSSRASGVEEFAVADSLRRALVCQARIGHTFGAQEVSERVVAVGRAGAEEDEVEQALEAAG